MRAYTHLRESTNRTTNIVQLELCNNYFAAPYGKSRRVLTYDKNNDQIDDVICQTEQNREHELFVFDMCVEKK